MILLTSIRERASMMNLGRQIFGRKGTVLLEAASRIARAHKYEPVIIDLHPQSSERMRIRLSFDTRQPIRTYQALDKNSSSDTLKTLKRLLPKKNTPFAANG